MCHPSNQLAVLQTSGIFIGHSSMCDIRLRVQKAILQHDLNRITIISYGIEVKTEITHSAEAQIYLKQPLMQPEHLHKAAT